MLGGKRARGMIVSYGMRDIYELMCGMFGELNGTNDFFYKLSAELSFNVPFREKYLIIKTNHECSKNQYPIQKAQIACA